MHNIHHDSLEKPCIASLKPVLFIMHRRESEAGAVGQWFISRGFAIDIRRPRFGDPLPKTMGDHSGAVIFGGPMSANDCDAYIKAEIDWIGVGLAAGKPFLGICLGAQMLSKYLGGMVRPHALGQVEAGYVPIHSANDDATSLSWPDCVYHWHREGFTVPNSACVLARGEVFENQAFAYGTAMGVQFHPEITLAMIHKWTTRHGHRLEDPGAQQGPHHIAGHLRHGAHVRRWLDECLTQAFIREP